MNKTQVRQAIANLDPALTKAQVDGIIAALQAELAKAREAHGVRLAHYELELSLRVRKDKRLGALLQELREKSGKIRRTIADEVGWSLSKLERIEAGDVFPDPPNLLALLNYYEVNSEEQKEFLQLLQEMKKFRSQHRREARLTT